MGRRVTLTSIAAEVGVTHGTVSRALRGDPRVRPETAARIQEVADRLGYVPNRIGRGLRMQRSYTLGLIVPDVSDPFFAQVIQAVQETVTRAGYCLIVAADGGDPLGGIQALWERRVDGLLLSGLAGARLPELHLPAPYVIVNDRSEPPDPCSVSNDDRAGFAALVEHLVDLGHRRLAYLGARHAPQTDATRREAFLVAARAWGLCIPEEDLPRAAGGGREHGWRAACDWLADTRATALLCFNDQLAIGALRACREAEVDVPGDLSVVGFDDIGAAAFTVPSLTTYAQPKLDLGEAAARALLTMLDGAPHPTKPTVLAGALVVRESSGPPGNVD